MNHCVYISIGLPHRHVCQQIVMNRLNGVFFLRLWHKEQSDTERTSHSAYFLFDFISFRAQCEIAEKGKRIEMSTSIRLKCRRFAALYPIRHVSMKLNFEH